MKAALTVPLQENHCADSWCLYLQLDNDVKYRKIFHNWNRSQRYSNSVQLYGFKGLSTGHSMHMHSMASSHANIKMKKGDRVWIRTHHNYGQNAVCGNVGQWCNFSGLKLWKMSIFKVSNLDISYHNLYKWDLLVFKKYIKIFQLNYTSNMCYACIRIRTFKRQQDLFAVKSIINCITT